MSTKIESFPRCPAHGDERCEYCSRITAEYLIDDGPACRACDYWGETGMHWDTCAGRLRGPITTSEKVQHEPFDGGGVRESQAGRARFELLVPLGVPYSEQLLTRCAVHMAKGAEKYASRNWESFSDDAALERAKASALRHIFQWLTSEDDGEDHAAAVVFNLMAAEHVKAKLKLGGTP